MDEQVLIAKPCCNGCWYEKNPGRRPARMEPLKRYLEGPRKGETIDELCVYCEKLTKSGIYIRMED